MTRPDNGLRKEEWLVRDCALQDAQRLVQQHHYARGGSNTGTYVHGLFRRDEPATLRGIAWWIPPTKAAALSVSDDWQKVLCLTRLVVVPDMPTNAASFLLSRSIKRIHRDGKWTTLLTYADEGQGHTGSIYRATNWTYIGRMKGSPTWISPDTGRHVSRKAGPITRKGSEMESLGYVNRGSSDKHKFVMKLRPRKRLEQASLMMEGIV